MNELTDNNMETLLNLLGYNLTMRTLMMDSLKQERTIKIQLELSILIGNNFDARVTNLEVLK